MSQFRVKGGVGTRKPSVSQFRVIQGQPPLARPTPVADRSGRCKAKDDTCKAYAVKGGELCAGHQRSADKEVEAVDEEG